MRLVLAQLWLGGDHYKWRLLRANGAEEKYVTGDGDGWEKFRRFAAVLPKAAGNPMVHWCHLELKNYFGWEDFLCEETAREVWELCNEKLQNDPGFSARGLILRSNVEMIGTTDDPCDSLEWHEKLAADADFPVKMDLKLRENCRYAIACPTSMGVRITPEDRMEVHNSTRFIMTSTSAETNVLNVASSLGRECLALTKFVKDSPVAAFIKAQLRARNIRYEGAEVEQGGPWGYRHQFNVADSGFGLRAPRVWNDRAGEVGRTLNAGEFDIPRIFGQEGVGILHISGLIAAMSEETTACCLALAKAAKEYGALVSFDLNYRASFWKGREAELREAFHQIASAADILVGNEEDFQLCLGFTGPEAGGKDLAAKIDSFKGMVSEVKAKYGNAKIFATTLRQVVSANEHLWGTLMLADGEWIVEEPRPIPVLDRIGGGDGFTGGVLYGVLNGWEPERCLQFGWASGVLAASSLNDYAEPADEKQIWDIYAGNARVQR